MFRTWLSFKLS